MDILQAANEINHELRELRLTGKSGLSDQYCIAIFNSIITLLQDNLVDAIFFSLVKPDEQNREALSWQYEFPDAEHAYRTGATLKELSLLLQTSRQPLQMICHKKNAKRFASLDERMQAKILQKTIWADVTMNAALPSLVVDETRPESTRPVMVYGAIKRDLQMIISQTSIPQQILSESLLQSITAVVADRDFGAIIIALSQQGGMGYLRKLIYTLNDGRLAQWSGSDRIDSLIACALQLGSQAQLQVDISMAKAFLQRSPIERQRFFEHTIWRNNNIIDEP